MHRATDDIHAKMDQGWESVTVLMVIHAQEVGWSEERSALAPPEPGQDAPFTFLAFNDVAMTSPILFNNRCPPYCPGACMRACAPALCCTPPPHCCGVGRWP